MSIAKQQQVIYRYTIYKEHIKINKKLQTISYRNKIIHYLSFSIFFRYMSINYAYIPKRWKKAQILTRLLYFK